MTETSPCASVSRPLRAHVDLAPEELGRVLNSQARIVLAVSHPRWSERPLACVVARPGARGRLDREALVDFLRPQVARWWLPDDVVFLDEIPKTSVGKFDKKVLRDRYRDHALPEPDARSQGL